MSLRLEKIDAKQRLNVVKMIEEIRGFYSRVDDLSGIRLNLVESIRERLAAAANSLEALHGTVNGNDVRILPTDAVVADWYLQVVGGIFLNYHRGFHETCSNQIGLDKIPLDVLSKIGCVDDKHIRNVIKTCFIEGGLFDPASEMQISMVKLVMLDFISPMPYEVKYAVYILHEKQAERMSIASITDSPCVNLLQYRETKTKNELGLSAQRILNQIVGAFSYLRERGLLS